MLIAPPLPPESFPLNVELVTVKLPKLPLKMPPPVPTPGPPLAVLPLIVEPFTVMVLPNWLAIPPPRSTAVLPLTVELARVTTPTIGVTDASRRRRPPNSR